MKKMEQFKERFLILKLVQITLAINLDQQAIGTTDKQN